MHAALTKHDYPNPPNLSKLGCKDENIRRTEMKKLIKKMKNGPSKFSADKIYFILGY